MAKSDLGKRYRQPADFHHPIPRCVVVYNELGGRVETGTYYCEQCELPLHYTKRDGFCHDPVKPRGPRMKALQTESLFGA